MKPARILFRSPARLIGSSVWRVVVILDAGGGRAVAYQWAREDDPARWGKFFWGAEETYTGGAPFLKPLYWQNEKQINAALAGEQLAIAI